MGDPKELVTKPVAKMNVGELMKALDAERFKSYQFDLFASCPNGQKLGGEMGFYEVDASVRQRSAQFAGVSLGRGVMRITPYESLKYQSEVDDLSFAVTIDGQHYRGDDKNKDGVLDHGQSLQDRYTKFVNDLRRFVTDPKQFKPIQCVSSNPVKI